MTPEEIRQHVTNKYLADILLEKKWPDRIEAFIRALNETMDLCIDNEERRAGEPTEQVMKIITIVRWPA